MHRVPNISLDESIRMEMEAMQLVTRGAGREVGGVAARAAARVAGRPGRRRTKPTPIVSLKPRDEWPEGWTQDDDRRRDPREAAR